MKSRKELLREYRERRKPAGIYQIKNTVSGAVYLGSSLDLDGVWNGHRFRLEAGVHPNESLQRDWQSLGPDRFAFEVLETVPVKEDAATPIEDELGLLEEIWLEKSRHGAFPLYRQTLDKGPGRK